VEGSGGEGRGGEEKEELTAELNVDKSERQQKRTPTEVNVDISERRQK
jgi:hypothetical protein